MRIFLALLLVFVALQARTLEEIKESGVVKIGVLSGKNSDFYALDRLLAERIAKDLDVELERIELVQNERIDALKSGKIDIAVANFTVTASRKKMVSFAAPYLKTYLGVLAKESASIESEWDFHFRSVAVVSGTIGENYMQKYHNHHTLVKLYETTAEAVSALVRGEADAFVTDNIIVIYEAKKHAGYAAKLVTMGDAEFVAPAVAKDNKELLKWLNNEIKALGKERFFHKIYERTLERILGGAIDVEDVLVEGDVIR